MQAYKAYKHIHKSMFGSTELNLAARDPNGPTKRSTKAKIYLSLAISTQLKLAKF
jgi:hypothetical protein